MNEYMIDIYLPRQADEDYFNLIPSQRVMVNKLLNEGVIINYSLSEDRKRLWVILLAGSLLEAKKIISKFPVFPYVEAKIYNLLFHQTTTNSLPQLWLN